ncbi:EF-hand domain-containing protein [Aurantiacibacter zhengii]|uniref:EF-hand domain-containing protein n=1 Tax=Aurantiacibacter zhengii TaxID=2307003 RepID=A0A418NPQ4_9SPHN|nr:EF-hand domain-containing protein [Aurantiacibacter zhengii]RIV84516.1 EF-hand domain-containing protein [Aurantiacibacter zhengii]
MKKLLMTTMVSAAALGLAACNSEDVENTPVDDIDEIVDEDEAYPVGGELSEDQQANYDAMDRQAVSDEYDANMASMQSGRDSGAMSDSSMDGNATSGSMSGSESMESDSMSEGDTMSGGTSMDGGDAMAGSSGSSQGNSMPTRSQMTFSYLDRNGDGQLSVAEYAIWALPTNPNPPEPNDALAPHLTQDQINEAGQTFFYFDDDGDSYLSQEEFQDARNSGRTA